MTNLSQQLCEICGIKLKLNCINCPQPCETACNNCSYSDLNYPDFENPENFIKLFTIITTIEDFTYSTGLYYIPYIPTYKQLSRLATSEGEYESENIDAIKAFLTCVIKCAAKEKDTADYIRETEWVYG